MSSEVKQALGLAGVIGQNRLVRQLGEMIAHGFSGHAYAFCAAPGMGKRTIAKALATHWLCLNPENGVPCGQCRGCTTFSAGTHPDVAIVSPMNGKIGIEPIRDMQKQFSEGAVYGRRLCLIESAELMNESAQNCLLKTLEEPPPETLLLLTTALFDALQATIRSRVVRLPLEGYREGEIRSIVSASTGRDLRAWPLAFSRGIPGRAMALMDSETLEDHRRRVLSLLDEKQGSEHLLSLWKYLGDNREAFEEVADLLMDLLRDLLAAREGAEAQLINADKTDTIRSIARVRSRKEWMEALLLVDDIRQALHRNLNGQLAVDALIAGLGPLFGR